MSGYPSVGINGLPGYDRWLIDGPDNDNIWTCGHCEEENNGGDECRECGDERRDLREEAADREAEDRLEARWAGDPGTDTWGGL